MNRNVNESSNRIDKAAQVTYTVYFKRRKGDSFRLNMASKCNATVPLGGLLYYR